MSEVSREFSDGTKWDNSIDYDDKPDGSDGGYTRHGNYIVTDAMVEIITLRQQSAAKQARIETLTAEVEEQARLLGASGSREVELLARVEALTLNSDALCMELLDKDKRVEALEVALTTIRYCEPFLGTGDCLTASEIAAEALRQETALSIYPLATVVNNNMPGTQHIIELPPNVTLDVGCKYRLVFVEEPTK